MTDDKREHTSGPWELFIDDTGGQWSGWPLSITTKDKMVVRTGGQWPYEWDDATSQREAVANARLIAAAPELLAVLENLIWAIKDVRGVDMEDYCPAEFREAREAISKATGTNL